MPDSRPFYNTSIGLCLTVLTFVVLLAYAGFQVEKLINRQEYLVTESVQEHYFKNDQAFTSADGFTVAAAITNWGDNRQPIEDPTIGTLKFTNVAWNVTNGYFVDRTELETRPCGEQDFDFSSSADEIQSRSTKFYPISPSSEFDFEIHREKLKCF